MTETLDVKTRLAEVRQRIASAAQASGRAADTIHLIAVTKYAAIDQIREVVQLGHRDLGENHVQSLMQRAALVDEWAARASHLPSSLPSAGMPDLLALPIRWHLIGPVQTAKARKAVELARLIHTVENLRIAEALHDESVDREVATDILVQINASGEATKGGIPLPAVPYLIETIESMPGLRCRGLMTMAPHGASESDLRRCFSRCREVFEDARSEGTAGAHFDVLSMGMSDDYEIAISEGANIVRIGSAIFGDPDPAAAVNTPLSEQNTPEIDSNNPGNASPQRDGPGDETALR